MLGWEASYESPGAHTIVVAGRRLFFDAAHSKGDDEYAVEGFTTDPTPCPLGQCKSWMS